MAYAGKQLIPPIGPPVSPTTSMTVISQVTLQVPPNSGGCFEFFGQPDGSGGSGLDADIYVLDAVTEASGFSVIADPNGTVLGVATVGTGPTPASVPTKKILTAGLREFVKVLLIIRKGTWSAFGSPVLLTSVQNVAQNVVANQNLSQIGGASIAIGQAAKAASLPVVIASDQGALAVSGTFWQATQPVSGTVAVSNFPATQPVSGTVAVSNLPATQPVSSTAQDPAFIAPSGTTAPSKIVVVEGKTNDGTPQYQPIPEGAGGRSVIVEGVAGGTAQPVSGTVTANQGTAVAVANGWPVKVTDGTNILAVPATLFKFRDLGSLQTIKGSAGTLFAVHIENNQAAAAWIQIFNVISGSVTLGTTTPDSEKLVAANSSADVVLPAHGAPFGTAMTIASTTAEKGATPSAAGVQAFGVYA